MPVALILLATMVPACQTSRPEVPSYVEHHVNHSAISSATANNENTDDYVPSFQQVVFEDEANDNGESADNLESTPLETILPGKLAPEPLGVPDVLLAVQASYPLLSAAYLERDVASGNNIAAWGEFDVNLKGYSLSRPEGFYQTYRQAVSVEKPLYSGGYLYGGYRLGEGTFAPWYGERETNGGGEFAAGVGIPLLKDRSIDKRRAELFKAQLERQRVEPEIQAQLIEFSRVATNIYWDWVAAGRARQTQADLLELSRLRVQNIQQRIELGDLKQITRINNEQLIASRETKLIDSERKLQAAAIKLSLFFRDPAGQPLLPDDSILPTRFVPQVLPSDEEFATAVDAAIAASPLLAEIDWVIRQTRIDLQQAENSLLPKLDAQLYASKDIGEPTSSKGDKTPFELEVGLFGEVPLQRREAYGKVTATQAKIRQLTVKRQFVAEKTTAAVQDAISAILNAHERIRRAEQNVSLADEALTLARIQFEEGDIELVELNIYEQATADAQLIEIAAKADFFKAIADYQAALSVIP